MSEQNISVGVVGVGAIGKNHARVFSEIEGAELAAIFDTDRARAEELAALYGARACSDLDEFAGLVRAATIATPTESHHAVGSHLLAQGIHTLIEKPIADSTEHALALADLAQEKNCILQVGHIERFNPILSALEEQLHNPRFIEAHRLSPFPHRSTDIGVVLDLMIHDLEIILHLVPSEVVHCDAVGVPVLSGREDIANARLRFANGCVANITASRISPEKLRKIRVFQGDAYLSLDYQSQSGEIYRREGLQIDRQSVAIEKEEPLRRELESFVHCAREGVRPVVSGREAAAALDLALQITRQIEEASQDSLPAGAAPR